MSFDHAGKEHYKNFAGPASSKRKALIVSIIEEVIEMRRWKMRSQSLSLALLWCSRVTGLSKRSFDKLSEAILSSIPNFNYEMHGDKQSKLIELLVPTR